MITAILVVYKRESNIPKIIESILKFKEINEIIISRQTYGENIGVWKRLEAAYKAGNDIIYTQDDDALIDNIEDIYKAFDGNSIAFGATEGLQEAYKKNHVALLGWGSFFKRDWVRNFILRYVEKYHLPDEVAMKQGDRIFTSWFDRHIMVPAKVTHLDGYKSPDAISEQEGNLRLIQEAITRGNSL